MPDLPKKSAIRYFGDYILLGEIARGGMGVVYHALQASLDREVAIKMIDAGKLAGESAIRRFQTEAEAMAQLDHPNIVAIYEVGEHEGQCYFAMKLVEGSSLAEQIAEGRWKVVANNRRERQQAIAQLMVTVAGAVHHAHQRGVLHRDIKPGNILLDEEGEPHVTDFGLAKLTENDATHSQTGAILGTPGYMAPEQSTGKTRQITTATDVYALGVVLYELLTGKRPFHAENAIEILKRVVQEEPQQPRTHNPLIDLDLDTICLKCLEKNPRSRYSSAEELASDLERWLRHEPILARPVKPWERLAKWALRHPGVAAMICLLVVVTFAGIGGITWQWRQAEAARLRAEHSSASASNTVGRLRIQLAEDSREKGTPGVELGYLAGILRQQPTNRIAAERLFSALGHRNYQLPACPPLTHFGDVLYADFSSDGSRVATASIDGRAMIFDARTGKIVGGPFIHKGEVQFARFTPDGKRLLTFSTENAARLWNIQPGAPGINRLLAELGGHRQEIACVDIDTAGSKALTASKDGTAQIWDIAAQPKPLHTLSHKGPLNWAAFSRDGGKVATVSEDRTALIWHADAGTPLTLPLTHPKGVGFCVFAPDGNTLATVSGSSVYLWEANTGKALAPPLVHRIEITKIAFSPDGLRLAVATSDPIYSQPAEGWIWGSSNGVWSVMGRPMRHEGTVQTVDFSPDGLTLLTASWDRTARLWDAHTGEPLSEPIIHKGMVFHAGFSPDGQSIVTASHDRTSVIWSVRLGRPENLWFRHLGIVTSLDFHPDDGTFLTSSKDGKVQLWDLNTGRTVQDFPHRFSTVLIARFAGDGERVVTADAQGMLRLWQTRTGRLLDEMQSVWGSIQSLQVSLMGNRMVALAGSTNAVVFDLQDGIGQLSLVTHLKGLHSARISADGQKIITAGSDGIGRIWNGSTGLLLNDRLVHRSGMTGISRDLLLNFLEEAKLKSAPLPDRNLNASNSIAAFDLPEWSHKDSATRVWAGSTPLTNLVLPNPAMGDYFRRMAYETSGIQMSWADFSADGTRVVTASFEGAAQVWDTATGRTVGPPLSHVGPLFHAEFSKDGRRVVSSSVDRTARVWNPSTGAAIAEPLAHKAPVRFAHFSVDGRKIVTAAMDNTVRVWDTETGLPLTDPLMNPSSVREVAFSPDGQRVVCIADDNYVGVWDLPSPRGPVPTFMLALAEALAGGKNLADAAESRDPYHLFNVSQQRRISKAQDFYSQWCRWMVSEPLVGTVSPLSEIGAKDYWNRLADGSDVRSLKQAVRINPSNAAALARLALAIARQHWNQNPRHTSEANSLIRRASELEPENKDIQRIYREIESINITKASP